MAKLWREAVSTLLERRMIRRWSALADSSTSTDMQTLRRVRSQARALRVRLDRVLRHSQERLTRPHIGQDTLPSPANADWAWRPKLWSQRLARPGHAAVPTRTAIGPEVTLFHDCRDSELTCRQFRNSRAEDIAPFGLRLDVFRFDGTFLSLVIDLPKEAVEGLTRSHIVRIDALLQLERPLEMFARLNIKHGPNTEQMVSEIARRDEPAHSVAEFDLAYSKLNEKQLDSAWIDLIFEAPELNEITLCDLTLSRHPRAAL